MEEANKHLETDEIAAEAKFEDPEYVLINNFQFYNFNANCRPPFTFFNLFNLALQGR
jgi:hypothetical protein